MGCSSGLLSCHSFARRGAGIPLATAKVAARGLGRFVIANCVCACLPFRLLTREVCNPRGVADRSGLVSARRTAASMFGLIDDTRSCAMPPYCSDGRITCPRCQPSLYWLVPPTLPCLSVRHVPSPAMGPLIAHSISHLYFPSYSVYPVKVCETTVV